MIIYYSLQTLTTLIINNNKIKDSGMKYFSEALQLNTVSEKENNDINTLFIIIYYLIFRGSLQSIFPTMK